MYMTRGSKGKLWWKCLSGAFAAVDHRRVSQAFSPQPVKVCFLCISCATVLWLPARACRKFPKRMDGIYVQEMMTMEKRQLVTLLINMLWQIWVWSSN